MREKRKVPLSPGPYITEDYQIDEAKRIEAVRPYLNLKPCPFCGGKAVLRAHMDTEWAEVGAYVECTRCWVQTVTYPVGIHTLGKLNTTPEECAENAAECWNRREPLQGGTK